MGRRKKNMVLEKVAIVDVAAEGKSLGRVEDKVVFVPYTLPGDVVDIRVTKNRKKFFEGRVEKFHEYSSDRIEPFCADFGTCGGCKWQMMPYDQQLKIKEQTVKDHLERLGGFKDLNYLPIVGAGSDRFYRNKLEFTFTPMRWLTNEQVNSEEDFERRGVGFHVPGGFDKVLDIDTCYLQDDFSNAIRNAMRTYMLEKDLSCYNMRDHHGFLRNLIIRNTSLGDRMVIVQVGENQEENIQGVMEFLKAKFPEITSLMYIINTKRNETIHDQDIVLFHGKEYMVEDFEGIKFKIGPKSFFQTNTKQALELYRITRDMAAISADDVVYDLYTGTGTIANFVAHQAKKVVGVEYVEEAIIDAKENSRFNNVENTVFYAGDMKDVLNEEFIKRNGKPDVLITDPPRAGMHESVTNVILKADPQRIIYVSCNSATQARDLQILDEKYKIVEVVAVDMFPQTAHVESVVKLERRE
jgi:23S rRNA (uracil1939-C5)-methyltransferase